MKKSIAVFMLFLIASCAQQPSDACKEMETKKLNLERDLTMYSTVWETMFSTRNIDLINADNFDTEATVVTATENITGIEAFKAYYNNYLIGFSDAEMIILSSFGEGDNLVKHWQFKGTHDGELFGIPASNNKVDISGVTLVTMKNGKILKEQDFFDNLSFLTQLGVIK
ncbi:MAG: ester cyclase [Flavobacteriaceae bacterium]|jgi:predicted ester cyclase|nr:ester cyclase [Flavobacteriaceae bacterium]MDO7599618.1 ester cyclase [Flavobacteriaceae bacterium]|tara:strand:- start:884 stop:1390 length:507 start_codon:yes stop_codon:yes gene_type:complete